MANGMLLLARRIFFQWDAGHHAVVVLLFFGATLVLPIGLVRVLKSYWQGATIVLPSCACYLAHLSPDLCSKYGCTRITTVGQSPAAMVQTWSYQLCLCIAEKWNPEVALFPRRSRFVLGKLCCFWSLIWHSMANGIILSQFHTSPPCSGSCACLGSHPSLANRTVVPQVPKLFRPIRL